MPHLFLGCIGISYKYELGPLLDYLVIKNVIFSIWWWEQLILVDSGKGAQTKGLFVVIGLDTSCLLGSYKSSFLLGGQNHFVKSLYRNWVQINSFLNVFHQIIIKEVNGEEYKVAMRI